MNPNELRLLFELAQNKGCKFTTLTYRSASTGELARHTLLFGVDYKKSLERDLKFLKRLKNRYEAVVTPTLQYQAVVELIESTENALSKYDGETLSKEATDKDIYESIAPGVKQHKDTGEYYIWAFGVSKDVIEPGKPSKPVKSKPLTIEKDRIRSRLRGNNYRNFKLRNITKAAVNGNTLILE